MKNKIPIFLTLFFLLPLTFFGQFRNIYLDTDSTNEVRNISFITPAEGYVAFETFIGYTQDSGHTFTRKYITIGNVDYNGYNANLTFGFDIKGIHVFNKNSFLVYGDYGFVPSILLTNDQGNTFKLIFNSTIKLSTANNGIENMVFPENNSVGFAVETNRILKTVNNGSTWASVLSDAGNSFYNIDFITNSTGYAISSKGLFKTTNGGSSWNFITTPQGDLKSLSFISEDKGWIVINYYNNSIYYTSNGGNTWTIKNDKDFYPVGSPVKFLNDSVGYSVGGLYNIFKTSDSGRIWEPLPRNNNYSYLFYGHNTLY
ncbi:MAG: YCF48-related protein, partial [Ginsengibacter sp.]